MTQTDITDRGPSRTVLVTGPTRGLGRAVVEELARRRPAPALVLLGRAGEALDEASGRARAAGSPEVVAVTVDLADLGQVRAAAAQVRSAVSDGRVPALTAVVANAGIQTRDRRATTADGVELTFGVNVLAQHVLLQGLEPALAPDAHLVLLGSGTHYGDRSMGLVAPPRWEDPALLRTPDDDAAAASDPRAGSRAYATSKLGVLYLAHAWQRRLAGHARVSVYDPGLMPGTGLARDLDPLRRAAWSAVLPALRVLPRVTSPTRSARPLADLATGEAHAGVNGAYVVLGRVEEPSAQSQDRRREDELVAALDAMVVPADREPAAAPSRS